MIKPHTHTIDTLLDTAHLFGDFLLVLLSWPVQIVHAWCKGLTFNFPWTAAADEDLQSASSDESRPQSGLKQRPQALPHRRSTTSNLSATQDSVDGFGAHQFWYPPPPAYEEEDHTQVRPPPLATPSLAPGLYPTLVPDEWRQYPNFPAAYPLSPVLGPAPPPGLQIVAPLPIRPSDVIDIDNMSNSDQNDDNEPVDNETRPGFHRSLLSSREFENPNSAVRLSDKNFAHGVQLEDKTKSCRRKRKRMSWEGRRVEDTMNVDGESVGEKQADTDGEMAEGDETFTTPKIRTMVVDSDAEMGDASGSEQEDSFSLQTPLPRRNGKRTRSSITIRRPSSTVTLNPRSDAPDVRSKLNPTFPPRPLPRHLAPQISIIPSGSSVRSASTTLSTVAGGDSLMTGDGSEREELETPSSPGFPSPVTYAADGSSEFHPPFPVPDVDTSLKVSVNVREQRVFPRTHATSTRSRPPTQGMAISSSSSGGANSRGSSRLRGNRRPYGLQTAARRKNIGGSGLNRTGVRPVANGSENTPITVPFPIPVSDPEEILKRKQIKGASGTGREMETHSDAPSNKKQKVTTPSLRKTSSVGSSTMPPQKRRPVAPVRIARSTSSGTSASSSNLGKGVGFTRGNKPAVRAARVRSSGTGSANESEW